MERECKVAEYLRRMQRYIMMIVNIKKMENVTIFQKQKYMSVMPYRCETFTKFNMIRELKLKKKQK